MKHIKLVSIGDCDEHTEKQLILFSYRDRQAFKPDDYIPTTFDNSDKYLTFEGQTINLQLWSTFNQENYKKLRPLTYPQTDIFLICFSLVHPNTLENVENMWLPEIKEYCPGVPFILVGTKLDYRDEFDQHEDEYKSRGWQPVSYEQGLAMKNKLGASDYIECSTLTLKNIDEVFEAAIRAVLHPRIVKPQQEPASKKKKSGFFNFFTKDKKKKSDKNKNQKDTKTDQTNQNQPSKKDMKKDDDINNQNIIDQNAHQKDSTIIKPDISSSNKTTNQNNSNQQDNNNNKFLNQQDNEPKNSNPNQSNKEQSSQNLNKIKTF